jgi:hypothetical protein
MKHLLKRAEAFGIGIRPLDENDFHNICLREKIVVIWSDEKFSFYFATSGQAFIVLPKRLKGLKLLFAAFHELGHHIFSAGVDTTVMWKDMPHEKDEQEADAIALLSIIPREYVGRTDFLDMYPLSFARRIYEERLRLYFLYGV